MVQLAGGGAASRFRAETRIQGMKGLLQKQARAERRISK